MIYRIFTLAVLATLLSFGLYLMKEGADTAPATDVQPRLNTPSESKTDSHHVALKSNPSAMQQGLDKGKSNPPDPIIRGEEKETLISNLALWATTYDQAALNKISKFVHSSDSEVRAAAVDAVVAVGIAEGADLLEEALRTMTIPEEIVETKQKIKFLRLPSALEIQR
jgi:hypothetical protein